MVVQQNKKFCFVCDMCCFYDVFEFNVLFVEKSIGEVYLCYYVFLDGFYCGCKVVDKGFDE